MNPPKDPEERKLAAILAKSDQRYQEERKRFVEEADAVQGVGAVTASHKGRVPWWVYLFFPRWYARALVREAKCEARAFFSEVEATRRYLTSEMPCDCPACRKRREEEGR